MCAQFTIEIFFAPARGGGARPPRPPLWLRLCIMLTLLVHMLYMQTETATWYWEKHWTKSETPLLLTETSFAQAQRSFSHWSTAFYHVVHHFNSVLFVQFQLVSILSLCPYPLNVYVWAVCAISVCFCLTGDLKAMVFSQAFHSKLGHCHGNSVCCLSSAICLWRSCTPLTG